MTDQPSCAWCSKPVHDQSIVCRDCASKAMADLLVLQHVAGEAETTIAKLDVVLGVGPAAHPEPDEADDTRPGPAWLRSPASASALSPTTLPVNFDAARRYGAAVNELLTWARHIQSERGRAMVLRHCEHVSCRRSDERLILGPRCGWHPLADLAAYLIGQTEWLRHRPEGDEALDKVQHAAEAIIKVVDRPADEWYAGDCDSCGEQLWPSAGAHKVRCHCGAEYETDERRAAMLRLLDEVWLGAEQLAHALAQLGVVANASTIRTWAERGRLAPHPESLPGRPRYRVGSVRELVDQMHAEQRERTLQAAVRAAETAERKAKKRQREMAL